MRVFLAVALLALVCGCCFNQPSVTTSLITTTTVAPVVEDVTTTVETASTTLPGENAATTTVPLEIIEAPAYKALDWFSFSVITAQGGRRPFNSTIEVEYGGKSDDGTQDVFEYRYSGFEQRPGQSVASMITSVKRFYRLDGGSWLLEQSIAYPKASSAGYSTFSFKPGKLELLFPLSVGQRWNGTTEVTERHMNRVVSRLIVNYESRVVGMSDLETPAGMFRCAVIETVEEEYIANRLLETTTLRINYCPAVRICAFCTSDNLLKSGKASEDVMVPDYKTILGLEESHSNETLTGYRIT